MCAKKDEGRKGRPDGFPKTEDHFSRNMKYVLVHIVNNFQSFVLAASTTRRSSHDMTSRNSVFTTLEGRDRKAHKFVGCVFVRNMILEWTSRESVLMKTHREHYRLQVPQDHHAFALRSLDKVKSLSFLQRASPYFTMYPPQLLIPPILCILAFLDPTAIVVNLEPIHDQHYIILIPPS
ncbi:unnamed protein product [Lepeophtheirus salmonis]|uniref:(salmon louse) hypothetical protein n=1 Tax=Lepeophtheirus salmonis TaxID=72036 RepID=A0A7R8D065_LEPSM|nr:unnamed protein product [Lepeophtheirus salmonis]CAF2981281.1 unnamed protein product [Lepeophtheirus salmonis]